MVVLLLLLTVAHQTLYVEAVPGGRASEVAAAFDEGLDFAELATLDERTFVSLNSTYLQYGVAVGAVLVLLAAVGLYLYDYYYGTSRSDPIPDPAYQQYYTDQEAYNQYLYQQAQYANQARYRQQLLFFLHPLGTFGKNISKKLILLLSNVYVRICDESINGGELTLNFNWGLLLCK